MTQLDLLGTTEKGMNRWRRVRALLILGLLSTGLVGQTVHQHPSTGRAVALGVGIAAADACWLVMSSHIGYGPTRVRVLAMAGCQIAGLWLCAWLPNGSAPAYLIAAAVSAASLLPLLWATLLTGTSIAALAVVLAIGDIGWRSNLLWSGSVAFALLLAVIRHQRDEQAEQDRVIAEEQARSETLAERAHLAREIHDVLAHSLSALSVQLETVAALLERDRTAEAATIVDQAGRLARDGLTETRRAVGALRGDPMPLPDLVRELTAGYGADLDAKAGFAVVGEPRPLRPEAGLTLFRAAQEALANVRKHAPGSEVEIQLTYGPGQVSLDVANGCATRPPLTGLSSGYGLIGMRERATLTGGTVTAGPSGDGWRVDVTIPA